MTAADWLAAKHDSLPLIHLPMSEMLLPGETKEITVDQAMMLTALDAAEDGCIGSLVTTPNRNVLAVVSLLEVREVHKLSVGAKVEVVAVGRVRLPTIDDGRYFEAHGVTNVCDSEVAQPDCMKLVKELRAMEMEHCRLRQRLEGDTGRSVATLDEVASQSREELCVIDLDRAPVEDLGRLHALWGVGCEASAELQLLSFAACRRLTALQRAMALGMTDSYERLDYARRCLLKAGQATAAQLAVKEALAAHELS